eukprot:GHVT01070360.1.p1 GENE.GHVT01070360.1~~GHVT01070360.1.p1  ORF type:complete len:166 (-),score=20.50 GHVT01070360.1:320-817(-)
MWLLMCCLRNGAEGRSSHAVSVWTDGACSNNGAVNAKAGYGVWFGNDDPDNYSGQLREGPPTNQRAELMGVLKGLESACKKTAGPVVVHTDSKYSIGCATDWLANWKSNGWKNAKKEVVKNAELIKRIDAVRNSHSGPITFRYVKGHSGDIGNEEADKLATKAIN